VAIRGILFDKDGTIVDYWRTWVPVNREAALYAAGGDPRLAAGDFMDIANAFAAHPEVPAASELVAGIAAVFVKGGAVYSQLIDGVHGALGVLHGRGLRLGIASNDSAAGVDTSLAQHDILHLFDFVAGSDSGYGAKPDPRMGLAFCQAVGLAREEVAVVGDAVHDLAMGRAAGLGLTIGVLSGTSAHDDLAALADLIVASVAELPGRPEFVAL
jgi:phosphoglycolate phosphatase